MSTSQLELEGVAVAAESTPDLRETTESNQRNVSAPKTEGRRRIKPASTREAPAGRPVILEPLLTFAEAARTLGISLRQFRRLVDGGKVAFVKVSERSPRVRPSDLQRFLEASAVKYSEVQS